MLLLKLSNSLADVCKHEFLYIYFQDPNDYPLIRDGFTEALHHEVATIFNHIPHEDLAIQWDCAIEDTLIEQALAKAGKANFKVEVDFLLQLQLMVQILV